MEENTIILGCGLVGFHPSSSCMFNTHLRPEHHIAEGEITELVILTPLSSNKVMKVILKQISVEVLQLQMHTPC